MKKLIPKIILIILIVSAIFMGKGYIDKRTYAFENEVNENLTNYFVKGDASGLTNITNLLETYKNNDTKRTNIQNYAYSVVGSWFTYLDGKYVCNNSNLNSCEVQLAEFKVLSTKLLNLSSYRSKSGYSIIIDSYYSSLKNQAEKKISDLEAMVKSSKTKNPKTSEEIRQDKCDKSTDCENCKDGVCKCYYTSNGVREGITCNKNIQS